MRFALTKSVVVYTFTIAVCVTGDFRSMRGEGADGMTAADEGRAELEIKVFLWHGELVSSLKLDTAFQRSLTECEA